MRIWFATTSLARIPKLENNIAFGKNMGKQKLFIMA